MFPRGHRVLISSIAVLGTCLAMAVLPACGSSEEGSIPVTGSKPGVGGPGGGGDLRESKVRNAPKVAPGGKIP